MDCGSKQMSLQKQLIYMLKLFWTIHRLEQPIFSFHKNLNNNPGVRFAFDLHS